METTNYEWFSKMIIQQVHQNVNLNHLYFTQMYIHPVQSAYHFLMKKKIGVPRSPLNRFYLEFKTYLMNLMQEIQPKLKPTRFIGKLW